MHGVLTSVGVMLFLTVFSEGTTRVNSSANPYRAIAGRNVFGLQPQIIPSTNQPVKLELPAITLTGLTTILGKEQALMTVGLPGKTLYHIAGEGERYGDIEVVEIDMKAGTVQVRQGGLWATLTLTKLHPGSPSSWNPTRLK